MATKKNLIIDQGADYSVNVAFSLDLTEYTGTAQIRKTYTSSSFYSFDVTTSNDGITLSLSANTSGSIPAGRYVYDAVVASNTGDVTRIVEGIVTVTPSVTR